MKISDSLPIVEKAVTKKKPIMLWGPPGVGKSALVHQIAMARGLKVLDLRLAQLEPTDLRGIPMPNTVTGRADWFLPSFWPTSVKDDGEYKGADGNKRSVKAGCCIDGPVNTA